jgi:hypothetical protein
MSGEAVHKILEPYLLAIALCGAILLVTGALLWLDGRARRKAEAAPSPQSPKDLS